MRHRVAGRHLSRTGEHRLAMRRNLVASLIEHETISTTEAKAKDVKAFAEKLITLAKDGTLAARRRAIARLGNRDIVEYENGKAVKKNTVIGKLFSEIGPRYLDRPGGYTRIIHLSLKRLGDNGRLVLLQLVGPEEAAKKDKKSRAGRRRKRAKEAQQAEETVKAVKQERAETKADEVVAKEQPDAEDVDVEKAETDSETGQSEKQQ